MTNRLNLYGNHRGGTCVVKQLPAEVARLYDPGWTLADPKPGRAERLARVVQDRFPGVHPRPLRLRAQEALAYASDGDRLVLSLDTVADTRQVLEARQEGQAATFQLVGRGPGGIASNRIALQGTLLPDDRETEGGTLLLLSTLEGVVQEASSQLLRRADPLTGIILAPMRELATRQTVRHLREKERDPWDLSHGPLSASFGTITYPLLPVRGQPRERHIRREELALEVAGSVPLKQWAERGARLRFAIVAVVVPEERSIFFLRVVQNGRRHVDGLTLFAPPSAMPMPLSSADLAVFTD